jgi:hypothetical protein
LLKSTPTPELKAMDAVLSLSSCTISLHLILSLPFWKSLLLNFRCLIPPDSYWFFLYQSSHVFSTRFSSLSPRMFQMRMLLTLPSLITELRASQKTFLNLM